MGLFRDDPLAGRLVLITGGSGGLGREIGLTLTDDQASRPRSDRRVDCALESATNRRVTV